MCITSSTKTGRELFCRERSREGTGVHVTLAMHAARRYRGMSLVGAVVVVRARGSDMKGVVRTSIVPERQERCGQRTGGCRIHARLWLHRSVQRGMKCGEILQEGCGVVLHRES